MPTPVNYANHSVTTQGDKISRNANGYIQGLPFLFEVLNKTAAYTITPADFSKVITVRGSSGSVTITLPSVATSYTGAWVLVVNLSAQTLILAATAAQMAVFNNLTATSAAYQTSSELIAGAFLAVCDGTSWVVMPLAEETQTITVA